MEMGENNEIDEEEEDWSDTRWAIPQDGLSSVKLPADVGKAQTVKMEEEKKVETGNLMSRMEINDHKAGMEGLDREKINQIIFEASKGSKFFENEKKKEEQVNKRIEEQNRKFDKLTDIQIQQGLIETNKLLVELEEGRDLSRNIVHVDMDAFYAAVEERDDPSLKDKPMAVGGLSMLSTSNYHARKYGVRAGMPGFIGKKLCPDLVLVHLNFDKYTAVSHQIREVMSQYDPNFCPMSLDEAYLDFTDHMISRKGKPASERTFFYHAEDDAVCCCIAENLDFDLEEQFKLSKEDLLRASLSASERNKIGPGKDIESLDVPSKCESSIEKKVASTCTMCGKPLPVVTSLSAKEFSVSLEDAVNEMRFRIHQKTKLTASAGIAANTMLAKVCSDRNKPNGQFMIPSTVEAVKDFVRDLPIRKISGIGKVSEKMLSAIGIKTCSDLLSKRGILFHLYSAISFNYFMRIALGIGSTKIVGEDSYKRKSYSNEQTFGEMSKPAELFKKCLELCESLSEGLKSENIKGKTVTLKIKTVKFEVKTKALSLKTLTNDFEPIYTAARDLLRAEIQAVVPHPLKLRLMGVRLSNLVSLDAESHKQETITDILKKMQSSPQKTKNTCPDISESITQTEESPSEMTLPLETPASIRLNPIDELKMKRTCTSELPNDSSLSISVDQFTEVKDSSGSANSRNKPAKKSIADIFKVQMSQISESSSPGACNVGKQPEVIVKDSQFDERIRLSECHEALGSNDLKKPHTVSNKPETAANNEESHSREAEAYECPICGKLFVGCLADKISLHVDRCLANSEDISGQNVNNNIKTGTKNSLALPSTSTQLLLDSVKHNHKDSNRIAPKSSTSLGKKKPSTPRRPAANSNPRQNLNESLLICPVCDLEQDTYDLVSFNRHVDSCLSKATIRQIVRQQDNAMPNKRLNPDGENKDTPPRKKVKVGTIDSFFKR